MPYPPLKNPLEVLMDKKLHECINGAHGDYLLPFLWLHGEDRERVREEILAIKNSGINQFCAESRPHEGFCRDSWWDDFGFILKTARELDMRVWLLDDKHFPTGYANGYLESEERAHLRKKLARQIQIEAIGPARAVSLYIDGRTREGERFISAHAYRHTGEGEVLEGESVIDLTHTYSDGMLYFDVPRGTWRVCVTIETAPFAYEGERLFYYIDMLNRESCRSMIEAVYQPHYEHFAEYFGNTFMGFFSDEPGFLNVVNTYFNTLGDRECSYPYRSDLTSLIAKSAGISEEKCALSISALWEDLGEITPLIRTHYMNVVTELYRENFSYLLGNWCREHGVMYIGHIIEDMGAHMRLGYGSGHYFRALDGQDMAGIDIVLMQDIVGIDETHISPLCNGGRATPSFFRYTLPKLAPSHAHIQPLKKGRAMCEVFGAFGWAQGLPFMKGLADIMLCSGVNYFVPHAFSSRIEDEDCPPHFYNGGKNPQYPLFKRLCDYMGRVSHMLDSSTHKADVAVFYNAEGEWCGRENQLFSEICKSLTQGGIDFDIIPLDYLKGARVEGKRLIVNNEDYGALIVSKSEVLPLDLLDTLYSLAKDGLDVIFTDSLPRASAEGAEISDFLPYFDTVPTISLISELKSRGHYHIKIEGEGAKYIRFYHATREDKDIYLFSNEAVYSVASVKITLPSEKECLIYEPWDNRLFCAYAEGGVLDLTIENGNMLFVIFGDKIPENTPRLTKMVEKATLPLLFDISVMDEGESEFTKIAEKSAPFDISAPDKYPHFSGKIKYTACFDRAELGKGFSVLNLGQVGEICEVWLNGEYIGARINAPYKFDLSPALSDKNELTVIVTTNLAHRRRDWLSTYMQIPPSGIIGDITIEKYDA